MNDAAFQRFIYHNRLGEYGPHTMRTRKARAPVSHLTFSMTAAEAQLYFGRGEGYS